METLNEAKILNIQGELQFGHGFGAVETADTHELNERTEIQRLQFGHGFGAVETAQVQAQIVANRTALQFGHGFGAVETGANQR